MLVPDCPFSECYWGIAVSFLGQKRSGEQEKPKLFLEVAYIHYKKQFI